MEWTIERLIPIAREIVRAKGEITVSILEDYSRGTQVPGPGFVKSKIPWTIFKQVVENAEDEEDLAAEMKRRQFCDYCANKDDCKKDPKECEYWQKYGEWFFEVGFDD